MKITPVPGDASTEPVATPEQSHVAGRVGPPTVTQDADAPWIGEGVDQIEPGEVKPEDTAWVGQVVDTDPDEDTENQSQSDGPVTAENKSATKPKTAPKAS